MSGAGLWQEKRRQLAVKLRDQRVDREASRATFQHERSEKLRRMGGLRHTQEMPRPAPRVQPSSNRQVSFVDLCNQRSTAPVAQAQAWDEFPTKPSPARPMGQQHGHTVAQVQDGFGLTFAGNFRFHGKDSNDPRVYDLSSAPRGFPLRKPGAGGHTAHTATKSRAWAEQATKASMQENGREQLDRLLIERVSNLSTMTMPSKKTTRIKVAI